MSEQQATNPEPASALPLTFEAWADLSARLSSLDTEARLSMLEAQHVDVEDWTACDTHYSLELADEVAQGRMDRAETYALKCVAEIERRRKQDDGAAPDLPEQKAQTEAELSARQEKHEAPPEDEAVKTPSFLHPQAVEPSVRTPVQRPPAALAGTAMAFELPAALRAPALPFSPATAPSPLATPSPPKPPRPPETPLGATMPLGTDLSAIVRSVMPFGEQGGPKAAEFPRMPLETYASLSAALAVYPHHTAAVLARYGVTSEAARAALDQDWQKRFGEFPATKEKWERLRAQYREQMEKQAR